MRSFSTKRFLIFVAALLAVSLAFWCVPRISLFRRHCSSKNSLSHILPCLLSPTSLCSVLPSTSSAYSVSTLRVAPPGAALAMAAAGGGIAAACGGDDAIIPSGDLLLCVGVNISVRLPSKASVSTRTHSEVCALVLQCVPYNSPIFDTPRKHVKPLSTFISSTYFPDTAGSQVITNALNRALSSGVHAQLLCRTPYEKPPAVPPLQVALLMALAATPRRVGTIPCPIPLCGEQVMRGQSFTEHIHCHNLPSEPSTGHFQLSREFSSIPEAEMYLVSLQDTTCHSYSACGPAHARASGATVRRFNCSASAPTAAYALDHAASASLKLASRDSKVVDPIRVRLSLRLFASYYRSLTFYPFLSLIFHFSSLQASDVSPLNQIRAGLGAGSAVSSKLERDCGANATVVANVDGSVTVTVTSTHSAHGSGAGGGFVAADSMPHYFPGLAATVSRILPLVLNDSASAWNMYFAEAKGCPQTTRPNFIRACTAFLAGIRNDGMPTDQGLWLDWAGLYPESFQRHVVFAKFTGYTSTDTLADNSIVTLGVDQSFRLTSSPENLMLFATCATLHTDHCFKIIDAANGSCLLQITGWCPEYNSTRILATAVCSHKSSDLIAVVLHYLRRAALAAAGVVELQVRLHVHDCVRGDGAAAKSALPSLTHEHYCCWHLTCDLLSLISAAVKKDGAGNASRIFSSYRGLMDTLSPDLWITAFYGFWLDIRELKHCKALFSREPYNLLDRVFSSFSYLDIGWANVNSAAEGSFSSLRFNQLQLSGRFRSLLCCDSAASFMATSWMLDNNQIHTATAQATASRLASHSVARGHHLANVSQLGSSYAAGAGAVVAPRASRRLTESMLRMLGAMFSGSLDRDVFSLAAEPLGITEEDIVTHEPLCKADPTLALAVLDTCSGAAVSPGAYSRFLSSHPGTSLTAVAFFALFASGASPLEPSAGAQLSSDVAAFVPGGAAGAAALPGAGAGAGGAAAAPPSRADIQAMDCSRPPRLLPALPPAAPAVVLPQPEAAAAGVAAGSLSSALRLAANGVPQFSHLTSVGRPSVRSMLLASTQIDTDPALSPSVVAHLSSLGQNPIALARFHGGVIFGHRTVVRLHLGAGRPKSFVPSRGAKDLSLAALIVIACRGVPLVPQPQASSSARKRGRDTT